MAPVAGASCKGLLLLPAAALLPSPQAAAELAGFRSNGRVLQGPFFSCSRARANGLARFQGQSRTSELCFTKLRPRRTWRQPFSCRFAAGAHRSGSGGVHTRAAAAAAVTAPAPPEQTVEPEDIEWWEEEWIDADWLEEDEFNEGIDQGKLDELMQAVDRRMAYDLDVRKMLDGLDTKLVQQAARRIARARFADKEKAAEILAALTPFVKLTQKAIPFMDMVNEEEYLLRKAYMEQKLSDAVSEVWDAKGAAIDANPLEVGVYLNLSPETEHSLARVLVRSDRAGVDVVEFLAVDLGDLPESLRQEIVAASAALDVQEKVRMERFQEGEWLPPHLAAGVVEEEAVTTEEPWEVWLGDDDEKSNELAQLEAARWQWLAQQAAFLRAFRRRAVETRVEAERAAMQKEEEEIGKEREAQVKGEESPRMKALKEELEKENAKPSFPSATPGEDGLQQPTTPSPAEYDPFILHVEKMAKMGMLPPLKYGPGRVLVSEVARAKALHRFMKADRLNREREKRRVMGLDYFFTGAAEGAPVGPQGGRYFEEQKVGGGFFWKPKAADPAPKEDDPYHEPFAITSSQLDELFAHFKEQDEFRFRQMDDYYIERDPLNWEISWQELTRVMHGDLVCPADSLTQDPSKPLDFSGPLWDRYPLAEADWKDILEKDGYKVIVEGDLDAENEPIFPTTKRRRQRVADIGLSLGGGEEEDEEEEEEEEEGEEQDEDVEVLEEEDGEEYDEVDDEELEPGEERLTMAQYKECLEAEARVAAQVLRELQTAGDDDEEYDDFYLNIEEKEIDMNPKKDEILTGPAALAPLSQ